MRAHEWTRARQRPVRQIGGPLGKPAEEEGSPAEGPGPLLLTEDQPEVGRGRPRAAATVTPEREPEPPFAEEPVHLEIEEADLLDEPSAEALVVEEPQPAVPAGPTLLESPRPARPPTVRRRRRPPAQQGQLPLQVEAVSTEPAGRSATETREDLIQRLLDPHLSLQETSKLLNVCPTTVRRYTNRGLLAHYRTPGNQRRFRLSDVLAFMERQGIPAHGLERKRSPLSASEQGPGDGA